MLRLHPSIRQLRKILRHWPLNHQPCSKTVMPDADLVRSGETSLKRVFSHYCDGPSGMECVNIEVRAGHRSRVSVHASHDALTLRSPWLTLAHLAHLAREVRGVKAAWCG
jgi:hypothetical protein